MCAERKISSGPLYDPSQRSRKSQCVKEARASAECVARCGHRALRSWDEGAEARAAFFASECGAFRLYPQRFGLVLLPSSPFDSEALLHLRVASAREVLNSIATCRAKKKASPNSWETARRRRRRGCGCSRTRK